MSQPIPLRPTADVFDESVLKVEFLPLPWQIPDFSLNLNTEALLKRSELFFKNLFGAVRVSGCGVTFSSQSDEITLEAGMVLYGNYVLRIGEAHAFQNDQSDRVLVARVTVIKLTSVSNPEIVNVNPPVTLQSMPGPNQYRYAVDFLYQASVPADTETTFHVKLANVSAYGVVTNELPLHDIPIGNISFADLINSKISKNGTTASTFAIGNTAAVLASDIDKTRTTNPTFGVGDSVAVLAKDIDKTRTTNATFGIGNTTAVLASDINKDGTIGAEFRVGVGTKNGGNGYKVLTEETPAVINPPAAPLNLRIEDVCAIAPDGLISVADGGVTLANEARTALLDHRALVNLAWDFNDIEGYGSEDSEFAISNEAYSATGYFSHDQLVDRRLAVPGGATYRVVSNLATVDDQTILTVTQNGIPVNLADVVATSEHPFVMHCGGATSFSVVAQGYMSDGVTQNPADRIEIDVSDVINNVPVSRVRLPLLIGCKYQIKVRAIASGILGVPAMLPSGSYQKYTQTQTYGSPFLVKLATLDATDASLSVAANPYGFTAVIAGYTPATAFEMVYVAGVEADFDNAQHTHVIFCDRRREFVTTDSRNYSIKIRPLIASQVVGTTLTASIVSGAGGFLPTDAVLFSKFISCWTFSGSHATQGSNFGTRTYLVRMDDSGGGIGYKYTPAGGSYRLSGIPTSNIGSVYVDATGFEYDIIYIENWPTSETQGITQLRLRCPVGSIDKSPAEGAWTINTSLRGRLLHELHSYPTPVRIVGVVFECQQLDAGQMLLRWYQDTPTGRTKANTLLISEEGKYSQLSNVVVSSVDGALDFALDCFDPGVAPNNNAAFMGTITVYARTISNTVAVIAEQSL